MVLNLGIKKVLLSLPIRSDQCKTGPLEVNFIVKAIIKEGKERKIAMITTNNKSKKRDI